MLKGQPLHPDILSTVAKAGHGALVLISDANFPASTKGGPGTRVFI